MSPPRESERSRGNVARYFTENGHVAWVFLAATLLFGVLGYLRMPQRKDPFIKVRAAVAVAVWPGAPREKVEELITRRIEQKITQNPDVETMESTSRTGVSIVTFKLRDTLPADSVGKTLDDIDLRLHAIGDLPAGASPVELQKDFGDTAALLLTVASPKVRSAELVLRGRAVTSALALERQGPREPRDPRSARRAVIFGFPLGADRPPVQRVVDVFARFAGQSGGVSDVRQVVGAGFIALDGTVPDRATWSTLATRFFREELSAADHPEIWEPVAIEQPEEAEAALRERAGDAYSYRQLETWSEQIARSLRALPAVAKVSLAGALDERIYLDYSQERLAQFGMPPSALRSAIAARNVQTPGGVLDAYGRTLAIEASGEYQSEKDIAGTRLSTTAKGAPVYVGDVVDVNRDYAPPTYTNFLSWRGPSGEFQRTRAITLSVQMRSGEQVARFSEQVGAALGEVGQLLPEDLVVQRTSDQAQQVKGKVALFMTSLLEAVAIIVLIALLSFGGWRSALVLAISIPVTLALTFIFMTALGVDLQQVSLGALILALGLLVDDPVVAGDAIQRHLDEGQSSRIAAWLGPTRLARPILFATITNIVAYLPFLLFTGDVGQFIYSLPVVLACSLVASRLVSMTFIPLLGRAILRPRGAPPARAARLVACYRSAVSWSIAHRYVVLGASLVLLALGATATARLRVNFFPSDHSRLFYADIFLPEDASFRTTSAAAAEAERITRRAAEAYGRVPGGAAGDKGEVLRSVTTFVGGGAPRFWYSLSPEQRQPNYAQLVIEVNDERDTAPLVPLLQRALTAQVPGAQIDVRELENGKPIPHPVEIRLSGGDPATLKTLAGRARALLSSIAIADRVRDDWGDGSFRLTVAVDAARAAAAGVSNVDVAEASAAGVSGVAINVLRDGAKLIPIVARLRYQDRSAAGDLGNLDVLTQRGSKVPLSDVARVAYQYDLEKIRHRDQQRTIAVSCFPVAGKLPSEVMKLARPGLDTLRASLPPGYTMRIGGAEETVVAATRESVIVALVSLLAIYLALVVQFKHALKPLLVFAAIPYGMCGAVLTLVGTGSLFGFTAILGVISLVGVIVSHVIVLFDYIEGRRESGVDIHRALLDAGSQRLRPVSLTTAATVLGLIPLAMHGGPLWVPLCLAQIGGLTVATAMTLVLVPTLYAVFVIDLKWIRWDEDQELTLVQPPRKIGLAAVNREPTTIRRVVPVPARSR